MILFPGNYNFQTSIQLFALTDHSFCETLDCDNQHILLYVLQA